MKNSSLLRSLFAFSLIYFCFSLELFSQNNFGWDKEYEQNKVFIENKNQFNFSYIYQFNEAIEFAYIGNSENFYFTKKGVQVELNKKEKHEKTPEEKQKRDERKKQEFKSLKEWQDFENAGLRFDFETDLTSFEWVGSNPDVEIIGEKMSSFYHSYNYVDKFGNSKDVNYVKSFSKLTYKNLYPNIDVEYEFHPTNGIKYSIIVHPGGDLSQVQLKYSKDFELTSLGTIITKTKFGNITDHTPLTFYADNKNNIIDSKYETIGNIVKFKVSDFDHSKTLIVDPWVETPAFATNWDCVWECEKDAAGNVYIIGGVMPLQLLKYNPAGALQWTYNTPYDTTMWLGTFATDDAGNSFVANGSTAMIQRINTAGGLVWNNNSPGGLFTSTEFWNISFNCDQSKLVIGGTGGFLPPLPYMYDVDMGSGNILASIQVTGSQLFPGPHEVRAITPTANEKYYFLTHDSIGYVNQDLDPCPGAGSMPFHVGTGYGLDYKNENWRYNNSGVEALAYYDGFIYVNRGNQLHKRDFNTGALIASAPIPGGGFAGVFFGGNQIQNSGISIDECGNVFVGSKNNVVRYDADLNQIATYATSFNVYDVEVTSGGIVIACGSTGTSATGTRTGYIQSFDVGACASFAMICCNPSICPVDPLCTTDGAVTLTIFTPGGTWSGGGAGLNTTTGVFNPAVAGPGTYTIYYTLPCGVDSITILVSDCLAIEVCEETSGELTASGGTPGFTWAYWGVTGTNCTGTVIAGFCVGGVWVDVYGWVNFATGSTVTVPGAATQIQITDALGTTLTITDLSTIISCSTSCDATISPAGPFCSNDANINLTAVDGGGTWSGTGIINASAGTFSPSTAGAGSHIITYTLPCGGVDTETIVVNGLDDAAFSYTSGSYCTSDANPTPTITGVGGGTFTITGTGSINASTGQVNIAASGVGSYTVTYTTTGACPNSSTFDIIITDGANATINPAGPFCSTASPVILTAADGGGTWSGTGIVNAATGAFDPLVAGVGSHIITYTISGSCGNVDTETIVVNNVDNAGFSYTFGSYCTSDANPTPTITGVGGGTFTITGTGSINASTGQVNIAASGVGSYTVTYTTTGACPNSSTFDIIITDGANATINPAGPFCSTASPVILTAADGGGTWSGTGIVNAATGAFDPLVAGVGSHIITYTISGSCGNVDTETIVVNNVDNAGFSYTFGSYCTSDANPTPTITGVGGGTFTITGTGSINASTGQVNIAASGVGSYTVTYTTTGACPNSSTFDIIITDGANATINPAGPFCWNDPAINLTAADAGGTWSGTGITNATNGTFNPTIAGPGSHVITYTIAGSCGGSDTETIIVNPLDNAGFNYPSASYCLTDSNPLPNITGLAGGTFTINAGGSINTSTGQVDILASGAGNYTITYTTNGTCPNSSTFNISISTQFNPTINPIGLICINSGDINLTASSAGGIWSGTGIVDEVNGIFSPSIAGVGSHEITYTIAGSCGGSDMITITINDLPEITTSPDVTIGYGQATQIYATGGGTYLWAPPTGLSCVNCSSPIASPISSTIYCVTVTTNQCVDTACVTIYVDNDFDCGNVFVPNAFSPNDDDKNNTLCVLGGCYTSFEFSIYDRWGELVFRSYDSSECWDGTFRNKPMNSGVYVYILNATLSNGNEVNLKGNTSLIR